MCYRACVVSIHAPWEGCDTSREVFNYLLTTFQFTHPGKGATASALGLLPMPTVSIHAPWEGCDVPVVCPPRRCGMFQFTHPGKGATVACCSYCVPYKVSIHAPWEGCDDCKPIAIAMTLCFNSRTLGRVRQSSSNNFANVNLRFNSRTLGRVRLTMEQTNNNNKMFQFTHPGKGATGAFLGSGVSQGAFQFTHPGKGATQS